MKLEEALDEKLYGQVKAAIDAINEKEPDKLKHIRYEDMSEGNYVLKDKYAALETDKASVDEKLKTAQGLIEQLKKGTKADETLQGKITEFETTVAALEAENKKLKTESALKLALLDADAKAADLDYLMFKAGQNGELKLKEDGKLEGQDDLVSGLKKQYPANFNAGQRRQYQEHRLETNNAGGDLEEPKTLAEALRQEYENNAE